MSGVPSLGSDDKRQRLPARLITSNYISDLPAMVAEFGCEILLKQDELSGRRGGNGRDEGCDGEEKGESGGERR